jgi:hypothetical protein
MKTLIWIERLFSIGTSVLVGAVCGLVVASFGHVISSSPLAVAVTVGLAAGLGAATGEWAGLAVGAILGVLGISLGYVVGGTPLGVGLTTLAGAILAGWLQWQDDRRSEEMAAQRRRQEKHTDSEAEQETDPFAGHEPSHDDMLVGQH